MTLRDLLKKATAIKRVGRAIDFGVGTPNQYTVIFANEDDAIRIEALHNCAKELLNVVEAAGEVARLRGPWKDTSTQYNDLELANDALDAALRGFREKKG